MIHYHGTPLTPQSEMAKMAGKHFCVSFWRPENADWCQRHGQSVMWDNGAFSAFQMGKTIDPVAFASWVEPRLGHPHWAVIPDVIDGEADVQRAMIAAWPHPMALSAPVWHLGLSIDWLLELADQCQRICFGSSRQYWQVGSPIWERRVDEAFNALERRGLRRWVHMLRGLAMAGDRWPFASADSTNVARNYKNDGGTCPERMARRIDAVQCPVKWQAREQQADMFSREATQ